MKKRRRLVTVAVLLVAIAALNVVILSEMEGGDPPLVRAWRLFLTVILALFLALGKNTARWIIVILTGLGALGGIAGVAILIAADIGLPISIVAWLSIMTLLYTAISAYLAFSSGIAREIRRASALPS
jgi:peptidoglycan/LPS O-acetylase OafA/YrhL